MAYTKGEALKLTMFWSVILCFIFFVIEGILAVAGGVPQGAIIAMFVIAIVFGVIAGGIWLYVKVKRTNRKLTA